jgi:hypothetical protein
LAGRGPGSVQVTRAKFTGFGGLALVALDGKKVAKDMGVSKLRIRSGGEGFGEF